MWWHDRTAVSRYVSDLLAAEFARIAPGRALPLRPWPAELTLDEGGLGCDSLDRLKLSVALGEAVHLGESGRDDTLLAQRTLGDWTQTVARALDARAERFTFKTSGSTGSPKWSVHERIDLDAEISAVVPRFADRRRVVGVVPAHHIYGFLWTLMLPAALGVPYADARASSPPGILGAAQPGDLIVGHPVFWDAALNATMPPGVQGVSSTGPLAAETARALRARGLERLTEIFGSSETAGIGLRDDPDAPFTLLPDWRRDAAGDVLVRRRPDGSEVPFRLPDRLAWTGERDFTPGGRREGAVVVGGHNVFPNRVRDVLCEHPAVADAAVRLMAPHEGDRLKAFVVPREPQADHDVLRAELYRWFDDRLTPPERPRAVTVGPRLPTGPMGKAADWAPG